MLSKELLGAVSVVLTAVAYVPYFHSILQRQTKPHLFSWIIWTLVAGIVCAAQYVKGAGPGSWMAGFTALMCLGVAAFAVDRGEKNITRGDWIALGGGFLAIVLWRLTENPLGAVLIACLIDLFACYPTYRKSYAKPWEESATSYSLQALRAVFALAALESYSIVTALPPAVLIVLNGFLTCLLLWRRAVVGSAKKLGGR